MSFNYLNLAKELLTNVDQSVKSSFNSKPDVIKDAYIATESFIKDNQDHYSQAVKARSDFSDKVSCTIDNVLNNSIAKESGFNPSAAQVAAARMIAPLAYAGIEAAKENMSKLANAGLNVAGIADDAVDFQISKEAYEGAATNTSYLYSIVYNFIAAKQEELVEMFYPTVVIDPTLASITVELKFASVMDEVIRPADGTLNKPLFNKKSMAKSIYDESTFGTDRNRLLPIYHEEKEEIYLKEAKTTTKVLGNEIVDIAPIKFGLQWNIMGIGQTPTQLSKGLADHTESLDRAINLQNIYVSLTNEESQKEYFKFDISKLSTNNFTYNPQGHNKDLILNCINQVISFDTRNTKQIHGQESQILAALPEGFIIDIMFDLNGYGNTQHGDIFVGTGIIKLVQVRNKSGDIIAKSHASYSAIEKAFESIKFEAYELFAHTTNSNLRKRAQLVTCDSYKEQYVIPVRSGLMTMVPVNNTLGSDNDIDSIVAPAQYLGAKMSMYGINTLFGMVDFLNEMTSGGAKRVLGPSDDYGFQSVARHVLYPAFVHSSINLTTLVSSIESKNRDEDIRAAILQEIVNNAMNLYLDSNYIVAFQNVLGGNTGIKPQLLVGVDPNIERLIVVDGKSEFDVGNSFTIKIKSTPNPKFKGKIVFSFGVKDVQKESVVNPLHFGFTGLAPNIVYELTKDSTNNTTSMERHYQPRFLHVTNLPIIGVIDVSGIDEVFKQLQFRVTNS